MSPDALTLAGYQAAFAAHLRDPRQPRPPSAPARRMRVYQELLFSNLEGFVLACYPVTRKILGQRSWRRLVRRFFIEHRSHSPLFRDIPKSFLDWAHARAEAVNAYRPFLTDLLQYEWLELDASLAPDTDHSQVDADGDVCAGVPALHPSVRLMASCWPLHHLGPRCQPDVPLASPHFYLLFRNRGAHVVFRTLDVLSARLLADAQGQSMSGDALIRAVSAGSSLADLEIRLEAGRRFLKQMYQQGALVGTRRLQ